MKTERAKMLLKRDDLVQVIAGRDKGKRGKITEVDLKMRRVTVEGVNLQTHFIRPSQKQPQGGIQKTEGSIDASNVMLVDPKLDVPTRMGKKKSEIEGKTHWVRFAKKSGTILN